MSRIRPYISRLNTWGNILQQKYYIPMNQRQYSWDENNVEEYLDDLFEIFTEGKYYYRMGSIIYLEYKGDNYPGIENLKKLNRWPGGSRFI